ncbi:hypothetical protein KEM48_002553 [Puccinia striiformis f. sp. tritici PST-130]|nr:hypothetical protein KEM48_002553 [Puccinia striiformis f. sp. tritici PST-130]
MNSDQSTLGDAGDSLLFGPVCDPVDNLDLRYEVDFRQDIIQAFETITTSGTFAAWAALPTTPPTGLHVDGVGKITMHIGKEQVRQLIETSHRAPFG